MATSPSTTIGPAGVTFPDGSVQAAAASSTYNTTTRVYTLTTGGIVQWTKPDDCKMAYIQLWGAGGGGNYGNAGGGGGYSFIHVPLSYLATTTNIKVGTGGGVGVSGTESSVPFATPYLSLSSMYANGGGGAVAYPGVAPVGGTGMFPGKAGDHGYNQSVTPIGGVSGLPSPWSGNYGAGGNGGWTAGSYGSGTNGAVIIVCY